MYTNFICIDLNKLIAKADKRIEKKSATKSTTFRGYRREKGNLLISEPPKRAPLWALKPEYR